MLYDSLNVSGFFFMSCVYRFLSPWKGSLKLLFSSTSDNYNTTCHYSDAFLAYFICSSVVVYFLSPSFFNANKTFLDFLNPPKWCTISAKLWNLFQYCCIGRIYDSLWNNSYILLDYIELSTQNKQFDIDNFCIEFDTWNNIENSTVI